MPSPQRIVRPWILLAAVVFVAGVLLPLWWSHSRTSATSQPEELSEATPARLKDYQQLCRGKELAADGQYAEALTLFEPVARAQADNAYGWDAEIQAGAAQVSLGKPDVGLPRLQRVIDTCPFEELVPAARIKLADTHSLLGQHEQAVGELDKVIADYAGSSQRVCAEALLGKTGVYGRTQQWGLVRAALQRIADEFPGGEDSMQRLAERQLGSLVQLVEEKESPVIDRWLTERKGHRVDTLPAETTTWTAAGGPYLVTAQLRIAAGSTLRMEAGTQVSFTVQGALTVEGALDASGTADRPIVLEPAAHDPAKGWWAGLRLGASRGARVKLAWCRMTGAECILRAEGGGLAELEHCVADRCGPVLVSGAAQVKLADCEVLNGYGSGVRCEQGAGLEMSRCQIRGAIGEGISLKHPPAGSFIRESGVESCGGDGLLLVGEHAPTIERCQIRDNGRNGIRCLGRGSPSIVETQVLGNGSIGIWLEEAPQATVRGCIITGNKADGVLAEGQYRGQVERNRMENNGQAGLHLRLGGTPSVTGNQLVSNKSVGLLLQEDAIPRALQDNQFVRNAKAALRHEGRSAVVAGKNWWGSADEAQIRQVIQDRATNPQWGEVQFRPWLSTPPASGPAQ